MLQRFGASASIVTLSLFALPAMSSAPFSFEGTTGRLPKDVVPQRYMLSIEPDAASHTVRGDETVVLDFRAPSARIQFNSFKQALSEVTLDGKPVSTVASDDKAQLTTLTLAAPAPVGTHTLHFRYTGRINDQPIGLFLQNYTDAAGKPGQMLTTQMESIYARQMFPCWDEPAFRAVFELSVTAPKAWSAVSNMPATGRELRGELAKTHFRATPTMPSYLVELTLGDLASVTANAGGTSFSVWAARGQESTGRYALGNAQQILADYNDYFGVRYPLPKLDSLAIPGGFQGAMENWGAITYTESVLLLTPRGTIGDRQSVYSVQAHEMAHQWFGDLVTMGWWDDIWLNESFASWMAARETDRRNPSWHWWLRQDGDKESAMSADSIEGVHAIEQHVTDEQLVDNTFDPQITYSKGQAILRMLEGYLGADRFRAAIRRHIQDRSYSNATTGDLWNALGKSSGQDISAIASTWTEKPGFPLITATSHCDATGMRTVELAQQRYLATGVESVASHWRVPLSVRSGMATSHAALLDGSKGTIAAGRCGEPLSLNADAIGYYRVRYDAGTRDANTRAFASIPAGDALTLLDDQWALASTGRAPLANYLALANRMPDGYEPQAWAQVAGAISAIEYAERDTPGHDAFIRRARALLKPVLTHLGLRNTPHETPDTIQLRQQLYSSLGQWGDADVLADARHRFESFETNHAAIAPDEQTAMLSVVAHQADSATFDRLLRLARATHDASEIERFYGALAEVADPALAQRVTELALGNSLPPQANSLPVHLVFTLAGHHQQLAWKSFSANVDKLLAYNPTFAALYIAQYAPQVFWSGVPIGEVESWSRAHVPASMSDEVDRGVRSAAFRLKRKQVLTREADGMQDPPATRN